ncbi:MBL fold metallo-hydrolase [Coprococcus catus]|uniref:MBL fold metallo-hydrolase n=1 Tax=Coprococcus catus TaxID=116085 RepID=UPI0015BA9F2C|nr:MBL fold metallo-hydrolase [Coprococcus catus]MBT9772181.1 MBL fold metallo-hydrolase [Coprococcus catus]MBX9231424.1 MBL fold metallo-hydrolase [Coprococcus catus]MCT6800627.1 MBL fold metallo-hydrolase [Coprococcus catus]MEE0142330.1 MBL fold metallo-hydrolase [Coprococcus sp.]
MGQIEIKSMTLGMVATNCYLIINKETKEALLIDPADNALRISNVIEENVCTLKAILLTHGHFDHIMALNELKKRYNVPVYAHEEEEDVLKQSSLNMSGMIGQIYTTQADIYVKDGEHLKLAGLDIIVLHTPGHTKGGVCYYLPEEKVLMSGDTLFHCSIGRTDFPTGSMSQLVRSVKEQLFVLPDDVQVYPGHDSVTSIGYEKQYNPFF